MNSIFTAISGLFARIRARLRSWLQPAVQGRPEPAALPVSTAPPAAPIATEATSAADLSAISAASASAVSASVASTSVVSATTASASVASASVASASVDSASDVSEISAASLSLAREAANSPGRSPVAAPAAAPAALAVPGDERVGVQQVRQFFARMASAGPGGLVVDFAAWGPVPVERFFMALGAAERGERRGPALADASSIGEAFQGFVWD